MLKYIVTLKFDLLLTQPANLYTICTQLKIEIYDPGPVFSRLIV